MSNGYDNGYHLIMQERVRSACQAAADIDPDELEEFIQKCDRALAIGPVVDPTLWRNNHRSLEALASNARALSAFRIALKDGTE
jgi:hypothetical protein